MEKTQCDLSAGIAKVDFKALQKTAGFAVFNLKEKVNHYLKEIDNSLFDKKYLRAKLNAQWSSQAADSLTIAIEVYATLMEAETREILEIVNKKEVETEE